MVWSLILTLGYTITKKIKFLINLKINFYDCIIKILVFFLKKKNSGFFLKFNLKTFKFVLELK